MDYKHLTGEQQTELQSQALLAIEQEHFNYSLALKRARASGSEQAEMFRKEMDALEDQHAALMGHNDVLSAPEAP